MLEQIEDKLLTVREVAKKLRCDPTSVRRWIASGVLDAVHLPHPGSRNSYRIKTSALTKILEGK